MAAPTRHFPPRIFLACPGLRLGFFCLCYVSLPGSPVWRLQAGAWFLCLCAARMTTCGLLLPVKRDVETHPPGTTNVSYRTLLKLPSPTGICADCLHIFDFRTVWTAYLVTTSNSFFGLPPSSYWLSWSRLSAVANGSVFIGTVLTIPLPQLPQKTSPSLVGFPQ